MPVDAPPNASVGVNVPVVAVMVAPWVNPKFVRALAAVVAPVPPLPSPSVPVTPVVRGNPVAYVSVAADGVPRFGVVRFGDVPKTRDPEPVSSVTAVARLALDGVPRKVANPLPNPRT